MSGPSRAASFKYGFTFTSNLYGQWMAAPNTMMRSPTRGFAFAVILVAMGGCSSNLRITLFNDSGMPVVVRSGGAAIQIDPNGSAEFTYPNQAEEWTLRVQRGACEYVYKVPRNLEQVPPAAQATYQIPGGLKVQLEPDLGMALLPAKAKTVAPIDSLAELQQAGFPLHPDAVAGCSIHPNEDSVGVATMLPDRSLRLELRGKHEGAIAEALVIVRPGDARYKQYVDHVGGLGPGETKPIPPWPSSK